MTKDELEKYARDNRKRLEAQEVKLGDVVKVLRGRFAGEKGVVVSAIACGSDFTDPYYEVDMARESSTFISPDKVASGLTASDFEVIGYYTPEKPTDEIKVGDRVKFKGEEEIKKMLEPSFWWGISIFADKEATIIGMGEPYGYRIDIDPSLGGIRREFFDKIPDIETAHKGEPLIIPVKADLDDTYWDAYHAELVKELAVKVANNNTINDSMIAYHIISFATQIVDNLKKQSE